MNTNKFYLLIIIIILIIIISLFIQCNKKVLKNLEEKATKDIIETYYHLGSAAPTESGQMGYRISSISEGRYGGRSKEEVLNNIGGHKKGDYISIEEKALYGSNLFNVTGSSLQPTNCVIDSVLVENACESSKEGHLIKNTHSITYPTYGGDSCETIYNGVIKRNNTSGLDFEDIIIDKTDNTIGYSYLTNNDTISNCDNKITNSNLLNITVRINNEITITEPTWSGFFSSKQLSKILFPTYSSGNKLVNGNTINWNELQILTNNKNGTYTTKIDGLSKNIITDSLATNYKYQKLGKYYDISIQRGYMFVFTNCGQTGREGPSQQQCDATYGSGFVETVKGIQNFIVPSDGIYKITAIGANGGNSSTDWGRGYLYEGQFNLKYNDNLKILIGQKGQDSGKAGGGGGATYVLKNEETKLIISGGGGGIYKGRNNTPYTVKNINFDWKVDITNYTNAKTYRNYEVANSNYIKDRKFYKFGLSNKKYGETSKLLKILNFIGPASFCKIEPAEEMGNGGKVSDCLYSSVGGFGGGGGGGGNDVTWFAPDSAGGGGGGYFGGASGSSEGTRGLVIAFIVSLEGNRNIDENHSTVTMIKDWLTDATKGIPLNFWNGIGGSSYINKEEADKISERVITDNDMDIYDTDGHGKVII